ncbi:MAG: UDP-N-acetylmuramoyl-L-alanyl-D-glutamate--2,6-diaminopimelate ligase [Alphaproteobacteria bacterium]|nr:UDP-N-acetylmuramoyl-L-alanyl-D-glutamate--2,6-diaminopimelate ligase [Alphaproteobacteria bacterium]
MTAIDVRASALTDADATLRPGTGDPDVTGLATDSRAVRPGMLFAALSGTRTDGARFVADAVRLGARVILGPPGIAAPDGVAVIEATNPRRALALAAARFFTAQPETIAAVTGTSGKTSVAAFARQLWTILGRSAASLGTLGIVAPHMVRSGALTTPDPVALHQDLAELAGAGVTHVAMEASSHGLDQFRLDGVRLKAAAFTNLSRDHLDYHPTMVAYLAAKQRLFTELLPAGGTAVLNADAPEFETLAAAARARGQRIIGFGRAGREIRLVEQTLDEDGQSLSIEAFGRRSELRLPLAGAFQAMNALAALGLVVGSGTEAPWAVQALAKLEVVPGRLQRVARRSNGAAIYVDYAHKPDALETVLRALRPHTARELVVVFGCGGDRDSGKRPLMGEIAARLADRVFVTDDNPRSEEPAAIRSQILRACPGATEVASRREAIFLATAGLQAGDVLVVAGKGHERGQIVGNIVHPFDDIEVARAAQRTADERVAS